MRTHARSIAAALACLAAAIPALAAQPGTAQVQKLDEVDVELVLHAVPNTIKFDKEKLTVDPGARVKLTLINEDEMQHNLLLCAAGENTWLQVAQAAWALGAEGMNKQYIPDSDLVLAATKLINPEQSDTIYFMAPKQPGVYPYVCTFPGHAFTMRGELHVGKVAPVSVTDLRYRYYEGAWTKLPDFDALEAVSEGALDGGQIDTAPAKRDQKMGFVYTGKLTIGSAGKYTFAVASDDGSRVKINGKTVVEWDGTHPTGPPKVGQVDLPAGDHELRVEYFNAMGPNHLAVGMASPGGAMADLSKTKLGDGGGGKVDDSHYVYVLDKARIVRGRMSGASSRAIAVGLPGEISYCFDAETGHVRFGWWGPFVDAGPERGHGSGRGGGGINPLGRKFRVGDAGFPLRIGDRAEEPTVEFLGYRLAPAGPTFMLTVDGHRVTQTVEPVPGRLGLRYRFAFDTAPAEPVRFLADPQGMELAADKGEWDAGTLTVPAADAKSFTVTVIDAGQ